MGTHPAQPGVINGMTPLDAFRLFMFHTAYDKMFASVSDLTLRFARALVYSSQPMTPEQEKHALTYRKEVKAMAEQMAEEREARIKAAREAGEDEGQHDGREEGDE
jgi:flagellar biosynthesis/type III secretory pathway protein FliH